MSLGPTLIVAIAMFTGVISQALSHRLRIPGVVVLLFVGVILGPDVVGVIRPRQLGGGLQAVVGFSIAVILFEGGLNLDIQRLKHQKVVIRRLVTIGALITAIGAALSVHGLADWGWRQSMIFGSLVVVTGPTVITPLLRRFRVVPSVHTILEAEGVFIDPIGAVLAVASLEVALNPSLVTVGEMAAYLGASLGIGAGLGAAGGLLIYLVCRFRKNIPVNLHCIFALSVAILVFETGNHLMSESGLAAVLVCGAVVGNSGLRGIEKIAAFEEQLSVLLLSVLFVLLAADVRFNDVLALGPAVIGVVLLLMFVVRPLNVWICSIGLGIPANERVFVSWLAPRGIVAAAVASFVAIELERNGVPGGRAIQALVFVVIAATVGLQGLSSGYVARVLGVAEPGRRGIAILGGNALARALAQCLRRGNKEVVLLDSDPNACRAAEELGLRIIYGDALRESALLFAGVKSRSVCVAVTTNEKVNYIFAEAISQGHFGPKLLVAESHQQQSVTTEMLQRIDAGLLFGRSLDIALWVARFRKVDVHVSQWIWQDGCEMQPLESIHPSILPMVRWRGEEAELIDEATVLASGDVLDLAVVISELSSAVIWLDRHGFSNAQPLLSTRSAA